MQGKHCYGMPGGAGCQIPTLPSTRLLPDQPRLRFPKTTRLNLATLLPGDDPNALSHDCFDLLNPNQAPWPDLRDMPWPAAQRTLFTNGSSMVQDGVRRAGLAVTIEDKVIWAQALSQGTSTQSEVIALTQALHWGNKELDILH